MTERYINPHTDFGFKRLFGSEFNKELLVSFLNALFHGEQTVRDITYLNSEHLGDRSDARRAIFDVYCTNERGEKFIVEMQMIWTPAFQQRVLFNASKAFVRQLRRNRKYELLQPVYSLNLVNETFMNDYPDEFIHNYNIVHELHSDKIIEGLHLTFVELPKFKPQTIAERKMAVLWLRFLTEINEETTVVPDELLQNPETSKALKEVEESAYTEHEMDAYEDFWDKLGAERLLLVDSNSISRKEGRKEGREEGREEGRKEERKDMAKKMLAMGMEKTTITKLTGLSDNELTMLFT